MVHGVYRVCSGTREGHTKCDSPRVVKSSITMGMDDPTMLNEKLVKILELEEDRFIAGFQ